MAVHKKTLTNRAVASLKVERDMVYWDRDLPGFGIRVYPGGGKVYIAQAREPDRTTRRVTVGRHDVLNADQARQRAALIIARIRAGEDPVPLPLAARFNGGPTVADLAGRYLEEHAAVRIKPRTRLRIRGMLNNHILPALGRLPLEAIERSDIVEFHQKLSNRPVTANKCVKVMSHMYRLGRGMGPGAGGLQSLPVGREISRAVPRAFPDRCRVHPARAGAGRGGRQRRRSADGGDGDPTRSITYDADRRPGGAPSNNRDRRRDPGGGPGAGRAGQAAAHGAADFRTSA